MPEKVRDAQIWKLHKDGLSNVEIGEALGVSHTTIWRRLKKINVAATGEAVEQGERIVQDNLDACGELKRLYRRTEKILCELEEIWQGDRDLEDYQRLLGRKNPVEALSDLQKELRNQLNLMNNISQTLFNVRQIQEFQQTVINEIRKVDPEVAREIVRRLTQINAMYGTLEGDYEHEVFK